MAGSLRFQREHFCVHGGSLVLRRGSRSLPEIRGRNHHSRKFTLGRRTVKPEEGAIQSLNQIREIPICLRGMEKSLPA